MKLYDTYRHRILFIKYLLIICVMTTSCEEDPYKFLYGRWKIYKYTPLYTRPGIFGLEEDRINNYLLGREVILSKNYMIIDGSKYKYPIYKIREENAEDYFFWYWRINKQDVQAIGIGENTDKISVLNVYINDEEKEEYATIDWPGGDKKEHLSFNEIVYYNGELGICEDAYFFHFKKVK